MNTFVYRNVSEDWYDCTNHLHSGLDFGNSNRYEFEIRAFCDGVVTVIGVESPNVEQPVGSRLGLQCYAPDGSRSNIVLSYQHLANPANAGIEVGDIFTTGSLMGVRISGNTIFPAHLHLEAFYYYTDGTSSGVRLNPLLLFGFTTTEEILDDMGPYYPVATIGTGEEPQVRYFELPPTDTADPWLRDFDDGYLAS